MATESEEMALEKPTTSVEEIPNMPDFNIDGPGSRPEKDFTLKRTDVSENSSPNKADISHLKKSNDTGNNPENYLTGRTVTIQNPLKGSSITCKGSETDNQWIVLDIIPDFMKCKICSSVFEMPQLLSCCGTNICKKCIDRHLQRLAMLANQQPSCPFCRSTEFKLIKNTALEQSVNQLKVQCCHQHKGCDWTGILENGKLHFKECAFTPIDCPNGCGCEQFEHRRLSDHMLICPHTHTNCSFETIGCDVKVPHLYQAAQKHATNYLSQHLLLIAQKNTQFLKDHRKLCTLLQSKGDISIGLKEQLISQNEALASANHKAKLLKENLQEMQQKIDSLETELRREEICLVELKKKVNQTKSTEAALKDSAAEIQADSVPKANGIASPPVHFTIDNFRKRIKLNDMWLSPPFYTHVGGYKMCLSVCPNNKLRGCNEHSVSVNIHFLAGEFDDHLTWPFPGAVFIITAFSQCADKCDRTVNLELVGKDTLHIRSKQIDGSLGFGFGVPIFLLHSNLPEFLRRGDSLKLMVYRVQFLPF